MRISPTFRLGRGDCGASAIDALTLWDGETGEFFY